MTRRVVAGALRLGVRRGWLMFRQLMTTGEGIWNTVVWNSIPLVVLILNRNDLVEGTALSVAVVALPGFLGIMIAAAAIGPAYYIAAEREDGTVLRAKAVPHGMLGYVTGVLTQSTLETILAVALLLVPGLFLFPSLVIGDPVRWAVFAAVLLLGLLASLPVGVVIGSTVRSPRIVGGIGFLVIGAATVISGVFFPIQSLPPWLQVVAQALPPYWIGVGMRFVFLPEAAVALEIGGQWRLLEMLGVLGVWGVAGFVLGPPLLRRMARRESGASLEASRQQALQRM